MKRITQITLPISTFLLLAIGILLAFGQTPNGVQNADDGGAEVLPQEITAEKDGMKMRLIPAGEFQMGTDESEIDSLVRDFATGSSVFFENEVPQRTVYVDAFYMDTTEVTNAMYLKFIVATGHRTVPTSWGDANYKQPTQPVVGVTWHDAMAYALWAGKRLPTEAEWEKAARGGLVEKRYPWGDKAPDGSQCNFADKNTNLGVGYSDKNADDGYKYPAPVGKYPPNGYGLYDMAGNVWEFCLDEYIADFYVNRPNPDRNPIAGAAHINDIVNNFIHITSRAKGNVLRGGSWRDRAYNVRVASRGRASSGTFIHTGFRCVGAVAPLTKAYLSTHTQIAFTLREIDGNTEIYVMDVEGTKQINLTNHSANDSNPSWSPDGRRIAFVSNRNGKSQDLYVMNADGTNPVNLTTQMAVLTAPSWSPDGTKIAFTSLCCGPRDIYVTNSDGTSLINLTNDRANNESPSWSPDGRKIAFVSNRDGNIDIYVMNSDGSSPINLTNHPKQDNFPSWSPDGTKIAFTSGRDGNEGGEEIYVMNADGSRPVRLTNHPARDALPSWSPDGTKIAFTSGRDGNNEIYIMNADGTEPINISNNTTIDEFPSWSPFLNDIQSPSDNVTGRFALSLGKGLNMIALPVRPDTPFTAQTLLEKLGATVLTKFDVERQTFVPYLPSISTDFPIEGGVGYIVNVIETKTVTFTGTVWDNVSAAPNGDHESNPQAERGNPVWAFAVGGELQNSGQSQFRPMTVRNLRTNTTLSANFNEHNRYAVAIADLTRQSVVEVGDVLEIRIDGIDGWIRYQVSEDDLRRAFARIDIDPSRLIPSQTQLLQNYPNPFNPETWIPYHLSSDADVAIDIYDVRGALIRRLDLGHQAAGFYADKHRAVYWDGKNAVGESVASGIYFYRLRAGDYVAVRRMLIAK